MLFPLHWSMLLKHGFWKKQSDLALFLRDDRHTALLTPLFKREVPP